MKLKKIILINICSCRTQFKNWSNFIFCTFQENAATLFLRRHQFLAVWIRSESYLIYLETEQSPIVKYMCATAIQSWSILRNELLLLKNWGQKVRASECIRMASEWRPNASECIQMLPEVSRCVQTIRISIKRESCGNKKLAWTIGK